MSVCLLSAALLACSSNPFSVFPRIDVIVTSTGNGSGTVIAPDPTVGINCQVVSGNLSNCTEDFPDAGGGGTFTLDATPATGSTFGGWTGCTSVSGLTCTLTFSPTAGDTTFRVQVRFDDPGPSAHPKAQIRAYNGTPIAGVSVVLQTPYDGVRTLGPMGTSIVVSDSMQVEVGAQFIMSSTIDGLTGSVTCTTTAAIIPNPSDTVTTGNALVAVFTDSTGTPTLSCNGVGWQ
jgi:hypothetical protein